jgi:hypothetical protein
LKRKILIGLIAALLPFIPHNAYADMLGNDWQRDCDKQNDYFALGVCLGEVLGEIEGISSGFYSQNLLVPFCIPPNRVTNKQLQDILYKYITDHPAERHFHLSILVLEALVEAFPRRSKDEACTGY